MPSTVLGTLNIKLKNLKIGYCYTHCIDEKFVPQVSKKCVQAYKV